MSTRYKGNCSYSLDMEVYYLEVSSPVNTIVEDMSDKSLGVNTENSWDTFRVTWMASMLVVDVYMSHTVGEGNTLVEVVDRVDTHCYQQ